MNTKQTQSKTIQVNGVPVTCYSDGSVELIDNRSGQSIQSFGTKTNGYRTRFVSGKRHLVHQLIAHAFLGPRPEGADVDHINGNPSDNRPENLRYMTHSDNLRASQKVRGKSKYRGVSRHLDAWQCNVQGKNGRICRRFPTELEAAES